MTRHRTNELSDRGMTFAEIMIASSILVVCLVSLSALLGGAISSSAMTRSRDEATNLANSALESYRNLPYDKVALKSGNPLGEILTPQTSGKYTIATECTWVSTGTPPVTAYKKLKVTVSWASPIAGKVEVNTIIYGKTALSGVGDLVVQLSNRESPDSLASPDLVVALREITFVGTLIHASTDESGTALFGRVPVGSYDLSVELPESSGYIVDTTSLAATVSTDSASTAVIYIQKPAKVTVTVHDPTGVLALTPVTITRSDGLVVGPVYTDANGDALFQGKLYGGVLYGDYAATVTLPDGWTATLPFTVGPAAAIARVDFRISPSGAPGVRAQVQDSNGTPIVGATVVATQGATVYTGTTGSDGVMLFTPVAGTCSVTVSKAGYTESTQDVTTLGGSDQKTLTFFLSAEPAGGMRILTYGTDQTAENNTIIVRGVLNGYYSNTLVTGPTPEGELLIKNLVPGDYTVQISGIAGSAKPIRVNGATPVGEIATVQLYTNSN